MFNSVSNGLASSGPDDIFEEDSYSPSSLSSSSSSSVHTVPSQQGKTLCTACGLEIVDRRYGTRCARCGRNIHSSDWVRRARGITFHLACFSCTSCKRQLSTGEECGLLENRVFCRTHYDIMMENIKRAKENEQPKAEDNMADKDESGSMPRPAKRARTSFTVDQLQVMQTQFAKDNNPDAQTLQKLAERTGLSRRVIQVWFQNCRARQKKHISPNSVSSTMMPSIAPDQMTPPLMEDLQYTTFMAPDTPLLTTLTYMDVQTPDSLLLQPLISHSLTQLPVSHA
ncbi:hypothetical protein INR49_002272 [Caranx melampygus]|nr:hypothetical protein INR49_002272 [Caranx melampygus]